MAQYIEFNTDAELEQFEEWLGRRFAKAQGVPYPMVPDWWSPGVQPVDRSQVAQYEYTAGVLKEDEGGGGIVEVDDWALALAPVSETLFDGTAIAFNVNMRKRPALLLSVKGRRAINPVERAIGGMKIRVPARARKRRQRRREGGG